MKNKNYILTKNDNKNNTHTNNILFTFLEISFVLHIKMNDEFSGKNSKSQNLFVYHMNRINEFRPLFFTYMK